MAKRFSVDAVFRAVDKFSKPVVKMENKLRRFGRNMERSLRPANRMATKFFKTFKKGALAVGAAAAAMAFFGRAVLQTGIDFDQSMANIAAITGQTRDQLAAMEAQARELGASTVFTAGEVAGAMNAMAKAGFDNQEIMANIPGILDAAAASGEGLAETGEIVAATLRGFSDQGLNATQVADALALASTKTLSTIGSLGESLTKTAQTANSLGVPFNNVVASVAALQNAGLDASIAGTAFNRMLISLTKPPKKIAKEMKRLRLSFKDAEGNMKPFNEVLETINELSTKTGGNMDRIAVLSELMGVRAAKAGTELGKLFETGALQELTTALENAEGSAKRMAEARLDTLAGDIELLTGELDDMKLAFFDMSEGPLRDIVQSMERWLAANRELIFEKINAFFEFIRRNGPFILDILGRMAKVIGFFAGLAGAIKLATAAMVVFNAVMAANPIGIVLTAIGLLIFFWKDLVGIWKEATLIVEKLYAKIIEGVKNIIPAPIRRLLGIQDRDPDAIPFLPEGASPGLNPLGAGASPQVLSSRSETVTTERVTVEVRDEANRTTITRGRPRRNTGLNIAQSGAPG